MVLKILGFLSFSVSFYLCIFLCSDDDSDVEVSNVLTNDKKGVLEFMQNATQSELLQMPYCSQKRANAILEARPFRDWRDLVQKFQNYRYLDTELLNSAQVCVKLFLCIITIQ